MKRHLFLILSAVLFSHALLAATAPGIQKGILDLRGGVLEVHPEISLSGEWEFYWHQLLEHEDFSNPNLNPTHFLKVPAVWNTLQHDSVFLPGHGYATYRIRVFLDDHSEPMAIKFGSINTAFRAYINDKLINGAGEVSEIKNLNEPGYTTGVVIFQAPADTFDVIIQVSNYNYCKGGINNNLTTIGKAQDIQNSWSAQIELLLLLLGCISIFAFYHLGLFHLNRQFKSAGYFAIFCVVLGMRALLVNEIYLLRLIPSFNWLILVRLEYLTLMFGAITFMLFINDVFKGYRYKKFTWIVLFFNTLSAIVVLFASVDVFTSLLIYYQVSMLMAAGYALFIVFKALFNGNRAARYIVLGLVILIGTIVNDVLYVNGVIQTGFIITYGFIIFIVSQAYMLSYQFHQMFDETRKLASDLEEINQNLEQTIVERTQEITDQNLLLVEQNEEISTQRDNIEKQHHLVMKQKQVITDSINYAQRIQRAVLPSNNKFIGHFKDHFILYEPRDIVSGDFYWFSVKDEKIIIVAADCTGHGVPGAFMSMLGMAFLAEISRLPEVNTPAKMLEFLREKIKQSLHQYDEDALQKEGMDMALCIINTQNNTLEFSGAYSPLYLIRNDEILIHKGDRQPVAVYLREREFTNNTIEILPNDRFYMFSDGYADQTHGVTKQKLMVKNFRDLLLKIHKLPMQEQKILLEKHLEEWKAGGPQIDDILVIGFQL
ncbi:MAG: SpoIIE family protein phosphatase [Bacteroidota bacterium]|nr:MAG: SpoIIE family protein phosphatase [Bacteroidota bacterium]